MFCVVFTKKPKKKKAKVFRNLEKDLDSILETVSESSKDKVAQDTLVALLQKGDEIQTLDDNVSRSVSRWWRIFQAVEGNGYLDQRLLLLSELALAARNVTKALELAKDFLRKAINKSEHSMRSNAWAMIIICHLRLDELGKALRAHDTAQWEFSWQEPLQVFEATLPKGESHGLKFYPQWYPLKEGLSPTKEQKCVRRTALMLEDLSHFTLEELNGVSKRPFAKAILPAEGQDSLVEMPGSSYQQVLLFYDDMFHYEGCELFPDTCEGLKTLADASYERGSADDKVEMTASVVKLGPFTATDWWASQYEGRVVCNVALRIPQSDEAGLSIGPEVELKWSLHEAICYDDSGVHKLWNYSDEDTWVLVVRRWHPGKVC